MAHKVSSHQGKPFNRTLTQKLFSAGMLLMLVLSAVLPVAPVMPVAVAQAQATVFPPPTFSHQRGFYTSPIQVTLSSTVPGAQIRYTTNGTTPTHEIGTVYNGTPINISATTALRAIAYTSGTNKSAVVTHTYIFINQVRDQTNEPPPGVDPANWPQRLPPPGWPSIFAANSDGYAVDKMGNKFTPDGYPADYEVDREITNRYGARVEEALLDIPTISLVTDLPYLWDPASGIYFNPNNKGGDPKSPIDPLGEGWERPVSIEWFAPPQWFSDTQTTPVSVGEMAGAEMHGQASRRPKNTPKHTFRISFKKKYGSGKLDFSLFDFGDPAAKFDHILLRNGGNRIWSYHDRDQRGEADYINDEWSRRIWIQMGHLGARGTYAHLYVNGLYWGVYNVTERLADNFLQSYLGGLETDYDFIVAEEESGDVPVATTGSLNQYAEIVRLLGGGPLPTAEDAKQAELAGFEDLHPTIPITTQLPLSDTAYSQVAALMDLENFADYMLHTHYIGKTDWPNHNWIAYRSRRPGTDTRLKWLSWDNDSGMNNEERRYEGASSILDYRATPSWMWLRLMTHEEFRQLYRDRIQKHILQSDGALSPASCGATYSELVQMLDPAIIGESARWGDYARDVYARPDATPPKSLPAYLYSYDIPPAENMTVTWPISSPYYAAAAAYSDINKSDMKSWKDVVTEKLAVYCPQRATNILNQYTTGTIKLRGVNSDPSDILPILVWTDTVKAPVFSQLGGGVAANFPLNINNTANAGAGDIYYTIDGTDPRAPGGTVSPSAQNGGDSVDVPITEVMKVQARVKNGTEWSALVSYMFYPPQPWENLVINEIHYHPSTPPAVDGDDYEFIELYNKGDTPLRLDDVTFTRGISYKFPYKTTMQPGEYIVLVSDLAGFKHSEYGHPTVTPFGEYRGNLSNNGEVLELRDGTTKFDGSGGVLIASVDFDDDHLVDPGWPLEPDGNGPSLELTDPTKPNVPTFQNNVLNGQVISHETNPRYQGANWHASTLNKGTPGRANTTPPTVAITAPAAGAQFVKDTPINITATASDVGGTVTKVEFFANGVAIVGCNNVTTEPYTCSWTPGTAGLYSLTAKATDNENGSTVSLPVDVTVTDPANQPPTVAIVNPAPDSSVTVGTVVAIEAAATDPDGTVASVSFTANGTPIEGCVDTTAPFECSWTPAVQGEYLLRATATDNKGTSTISAAVKVIANAAGNTPPTVSITSPAAMAQFNVNDKVTVVATASDSDGTVAQVAFFANGAQIAGCVDVQAPYECEWTPTSAGVHSLTARALDNGGATTSSEIIAVAVNQPGNQLPTASINSPANGSTVQVGQTVVIEATASDPDGTVAEVTFYANGLPIFNCVDTTFPYACIWQPSTAGTYNLTVVVKDDKGGVAFSAPVSVESVILNNQQPTASITSPSNGSSFLVGDTVAIKADASDPDGTITKVVFLANGVQIGNCVDTAAPYECNWTPDTNGQVNLTVQATDNNGITTTSAPVVVAVNKPGSQLPTVTITSPANGAIVKVNEPLLITVNAAVGTRSGNAGNAVIERVEFFVDGTQIPGCVDTSAPFQCTWTPTQARQYSLTALATDDEGNVGTAFAVTVTATEEGSSGREGDIFLPLVRRQ
jgi:hypothetical protein